MTDELSHSPAFLPNARLSAAAPFLVIGSTGAACFAVATIADPSTLRLFSEMLIYLMLAQLWNLLAGYAGLVSVGQQAFVGIGGYAFFYSTTTLGIHPLLGLATGGLASLLAGAVSTIFIFRLKGAYFAIGTWVIAEICLLTVAIIPELGGGSGMSLSAKIVRTLGATGEQRASAYFTLAALLAIVTVTAIYLLMRSRIGLAMVAVRDSERAAEALGVNAARIKRMVYIGVAFATGLVGGLIFLMKLRMTPDAAFSVLDWTAYVLFIVVIGGVGRIEGPFIGTVIFFGLRAVLADYGPIYLVVLGCVAVVAMLFAPKGACGLISRWFDFEVFPVRRRTPSAS